MHKIEDETLRKFAQQMDQGRQYWPRAYIILGSDGVMYRQGQGVWLASSISWLHLLRLSLIDNILRV